MLDDPRLNFSLVARGAAPGVDHLGIQVEDEGELAEVYARLRASEGAIAEEGAVTCCYHESEKSWVVDPQGVAWEAFLTHGESETFGEATRLGAEAQACCGPESHNAAAKPAAPGEGTKTCCGQANVASGCCA
jgi:hypothetical protein